jgi:nicotinamidase-related amidase
MMSANVALLIIDMQKAIDHPSWGRRNNSTTEINISCLLSSWRHNGKLVIHIRHSSREEKSTYRPNQEGFEFKPEVQPQNGETIITKSTNNAFIGTELEAILFHNGISTVIICGVTTNNSVEATARMAGDLGYQTFVVSDATAAFDKVDYAGHHRTAEEVHAMSLANLHGEYATVASTEEVLTKLLEKKS